MTAASLAATDENDDGESNDNNVEILLMEWKFERNFKNTNFWAFWSRKNQASMKHTGNIWAGMVLVYNHWFLKFSFRNLSVKPKAMEGNMQSNDLWINSLRKLSRPQNFAWPVLLWEGICFAKITESVKTKG